MKKSLLTLSLLLAAGSVSAAPFYADIGTNYDGLIAPVGDKECDTCTSMKDEFLLTYDSQTTIFDFDANGIDAGDGVSTDGGLAVGGLDTNQFTGFLPNESFGSDSNNGYGGSNWLISFSITGLLGTVTGVTGGLPTFVYGPGVIELYVTEDGTTFNNFMDVNVAGGFTDGFGTLLQGTIDFTNVQAGYNDLFHSGTYDCAGSDAFIDIWTNCGDGAGLDLDISFVTHFDSGIHVSQAVDNQDGTLTITSNHDGSGTFSVPEPTTLALLGSSLLMLGGMRRNKKS